MIVNEEEWELGDCPYFARYYNIEGHDPNAICYMGCHQEPACVTDEPLEGWTNDPRRKK